MSSLAQDIRLCFQPRRSTKRKNTSVRTGRALDESNSTAVESGRGFDDYYDEHHDHETTTTPKPMKQGRYTDPWAGYYDWIINEGSFKFWSVFQVDSLWYYFHCVLIFYAFMQLPDFQRHIQNKIKLIEQLKLNWTDCGCWNLLLNLLTKNILTQLPSNIINLKVRMSCCSIT